jgi:predicted metal-dependent phosphoesterase TrpH
MLKADFHIHTKLSKHHFLNKLGLTDAFNTAEELTKNAKQKGFDCIAFTEHNVLFDYKEAERLSKKYKIVVLPGIELRLPSKKEIIAINITTIPKSTNLKQIRKEVHKQGGILIAPHPYDPLGRGYKELEHFDAIEIINGFGSFGFKKLIKSAEELNKTKVCGSDTHCTAQLGYTDFLIDSKPDKDSIINAIKDGKTKIHNKTIPKYVQLWYYLQKYALLKTLRK